MSKETRYAVAADYLFDGEEVKTDHAVIVDGGRIAAVVMRDAIPDSIPVHAMAAGLWLAPGFIDLQINGGGDVLFNDDPSPQAIAAISAAHAKSGTTAFLPTLITDSGEKMRLARAAADVAMRETPGVLGIHFEGPFLSPEKAGVHDPHLMRAPTPEDMPLLTPAGGEVLVTLAPERVPRGFIRTLTQAGAQVALGHSMATHDETRTAIGEGLRGFTHLYNAMRPMTAREPGPIAAALESPECWHGLIADGEHVAPAMLRLALQSTGRSVLVSDAMPPVNGVSAQFMLQGRAISCADGRCVTADGRLAGSVLTLANAVRHCVRLLQLPLPDALRLASRVPAECIGLGHKLGRLAKGYRADMVAFDPSDIRVVRTWIAGQAGEGENDGHRE